MSLPPDVRKKPSPAANQLTYCLSDSILIGPHRGNRGPCLIIVNHYFNHYPYSRIVTLKRICRLLPAEHRTTSLNEHSHLQKHVLILLKYTPNKLYA